MMLRWISELPPAIVLANDMKKPCDQRPYSRRTSSSVTGADRPDDLHAELVRGLARSEVAIFMYECSGADEPCANDAKPL